MPTTDEELSQLEKDIRQLKIEYEQYFAGGRKRPPTEIEWRVELCIKRYTEKGSQINYGQRFRFNGLTQTYAKYREIFRKRTKQREEGTVIRHFGAAAREIEAERAKAGKSEVRPEMAATRAASGSRAVVADSETQKLYEAFRDAKRKTGEDVSQLTFDSFRDFVSRKRDQLTQKTDGDIEFAVEITGGRVRLKARVHNPQNQRN